MNGGFGLLGSFSGDGGGGGGGGGVSSDESTTGGSMLTSKNNVMLAEVSSPFQFVVDDDKNLELGLGLSIGGGGGGGGLNSINSVVGWGKYARILTAKDLPHVSVSPPSVVGWPPIRRGHRLVNQTKSPDEESNSEPEPKTTLKKDVCCSETKKREFNKVYQSVKVNMDGTLIGRKVDLNAHTSYETLARTLEDMFCPKRSRKTGLSKLLDATSEFVLTYEDKDGDCMLVGDVPWPMFLSSVKRLRIMRNSESNNLGSHQRTIEAQTCQERNTRRRINDT
ncbi:auxin-responsive protein IAA13-like [Rutidosis leptorrhynchoides]|uniref:auxin-responsive protein IAA13-like n=1 Tax=Rutidosis leptorrhynchoides TaxID=125765 RepID=UPI003A99BD30